MSDIAIRVENLSKKYRIGAQQALHKTLRELLASAVRAPFRFTSRKEDNTFWALSDVSFEIRQGETVGIIGRNGAGKSTLLKILSRITKPTHGRAELYGRVGSLLEVGTGFHTELTGRENIYLNGAILGMRRSEIDRKFDEIVAFAETERFLDTPVKHYSSGMYVRLAFAVAAHLEPEILVVDEVLAVGDAAFQKKCLGKMGDVAQNDGRTILFVSHNMSMINSLCSRALLLDAGDVILDGQVSEAISRYYNSGESSPFAMDYSRLIHPPGDMYSTLLEAWIEDENGNVLGEVDINAPFVVKMRYRLRQDVPIAPYANFHVSTAQGQYVFVTSSDQNLPVNKAGVYEAACSIPGNLLNNDTYSVGLALTFTHNGIHKSFFERNALMVTIREKIDETLDKGRSGFSGAIPGIVRPKLDWIVKRIE